MIKKIKKILWPYYNKLKTLLKIHIFKDKLFIARQEFRRDNAVRNLRYAYPLNRDSVVFDLGGYIGEWAEQIWKLYGCNIYSFEPVKKFYDTSVAKFKNNNKVHLFNFGLSDTDSMQMISIDGVSSSVFIGKRDTEIQLKDVKKVFDSLNIKRIHLLKMNIEGGEYQVLPRMIETGMIPLCDDIQIEFHHFYPESEKLRSEIQATLKKTHHLTYDYPFFFENWKINT